MGWFLPSHMDSGLIFGLLGLWHSFNILHSYICNPGRFRSRAWFPALVPRVPRALELWILLLIVTVFITKQLSYATEDLASRVIQSEHLIRFQHAAFSLMYLAYISVALINENSSFLPLPDGALQATFALGFLSELIVFHYGHHPGDNLESYVHMLMQLVLAALVLLMFLEIRYSSSVLVASARSMCLVLKGTWFFYIGVLINVPSSIPLGCSIPEELDFPSCPLEMDNRRAKAIQVLIFIVQAVAIVVLTFVGYAILKWALGAKSESADYQEVSDEVSEDNSQVYFVVDKDGDFVDEINKAGVPILKDLPRSLSRRLSKRSAINTPVGGKDVHISAVSTPLPKSGLMVSSPLPKNIKNV